jgi:hypothetical protein
MASLWSKRWVRCLSTALSLIVIVCLLACWHWRIWSAEDYRNYQRVGRYALGHDLWFGRIAPGEDIETVIAQARPHALRRFGRFTIIEYYLGGPLMANGLSWDRLALIAKDGRLVSAGASSCIWHQEFFGMSAEDLDLWLMAYNQARKELLP